MHKLFVVLVVMMLPIRAGAADVTVRIEEFGIYRLERSPEVRAELVQATDRIPLKQGITFGVSISVQGSGNEREWTLRKITRFPAPGLTNPQTGRTRSYSETLVSFYAGQMPLGLFTFDHPWEMVPGTWAIEYWLGEEKLTEKRFTVGR